MRIANARIREAVLNGVPSTGPPSLKSKWARARYISPLGINEAFSEAIKLVNDESASLKAKADKLAAGAEKDHLLSKAELHNPEVKYNYLTGKLDLSQPIYRYLAKRDWSRHEMLILMQRLEQHHVIPDTMPTLDPQAQVQLQFITPNRQYLEPGKFVENSICERRPEITIRDFSISSDQLDNQLYTVLIVNPDIPDLANDSFKTGLTFAAANASVSPTKPVVDWDKTQVLSGYVPPHPEKNAPAQRLCVWVFRQSKPITEASLGDTENFDIRAFAEANGLQAVGAHLWRVKWDQSTPHIIEKYGLPKGNVYFRARTMKPEDALLHIRDRKKWEPVVGRDTK